MARALAGLVAAGAVTIGVAAMPPAGPDSPRAHEGAVLVPSVVRVLVPGTGAVPEFATGFVVAPGRLLTVAHPLAGREWVTVYDAAGRAVPARVVSMDRTNDLAVLRARRVSSSPMAVAPGRGVRVLVRRGRRMRALPALIRRRITASVREGPGRRAHTRPALELAVDVLKGDSGAPLLNGDGHLIGLIFARSRARESTAYAVALASARR